MNPWKVGCIDSAEHGLANVLAGRMIRIHGSGKKLMGGKADEPTSPNGSMVAERHMATPGTLAFTYPPTRRTTNHARSINKPGELPGWKVDTYYIGVGIGASKGGNGCRPEMLR